MDTKKWKVDEDGIYMKSVSQVYIPWLERSFEVWVDLDTDQRWFTPNQKDALEKFISVSKKTQVCAALEKCYHRELKKNTIESLEFTDILETIHWAETQICIPQQAQSKNNYILFLPETNWKIVDSDFTLELEVLFTNDTVETCQEMSGLWCRTEWFDYYLKRPIITV